MQAVLILLYISKDTWKMLKVLNVQAARLSCTACMDSCHVTMDMTFTLEGHQVKHWICCGAEKEVN